MSTLNVAAVQDVDAGGPKATLATSGGSNFTLGPNWGVMEFVSTAAITAVANISITGIAAGYDYIIQLEAFCPTTDSNYLFLRVSEDGGGAYKSGVSDYSWLVGDGNSDAADSEINISSAVGGNLMGNDANNLNTAEITLVNPGGTGESMTVHFNGIQESEASTPIPARINGGGTYIGSTAAVDAVQFGWGTNYGTDTFKAQGDVVVWRRRRS